MSIEFDMVPVFRLAPGDWIVLDDGSRCQVKGTDMERCSKDQMRTRLRGRTPIVVRGYYENIVRRIKR